MKPQYRDVLLLIAAVLIAWFGTDWILRHNITFWKFSRQGARSVTAKPLAIESQLRLIPPDSAEVLIVGASVVAFDINVLQFSRHLGVEQKAVQTIMLPGAKAVELAMLAPDIAASTPHTVLLVVTVGTLYDGFDYEDIRFYNPRVAAELFTPEEMLQQRRFHTSGLLARSHTALRHRDALREALFPALYVRRIVRQSRMDVRDDHVRGFLETYAQRTAEQHRCDGISGRATRFLAQHLVDLGIRVVAAVAPINNKWQDDPELVTLLDTCMMNAAEQIGFTYVGTDQLPEFTPDDFIDELHMSKRGRSAYTLHLLRHIRTGPGRHL